MSVVLRRRDGSTRPLDLDAWHAPATTVERDLLRSLPGPVLDLGCGPGRIVVALGELGIPALGIDASEHAISHARARGAPVLQYSIFDRLPGEGRWQTALLLDGNIGIGGSPGALLKRVARLLRAGGRVVVETEPPGSGTIETEARLERASEVSGWFPWAWVSADDIMALATTAGLRLAGWHAADGRWFATLRN